MAGVLWNSWLWLPVFEHEQRPGGGATLDRYMMVMLGGATGSLARYVLGTVIMTRLGPRFPMGTFVINVTGSFLIGLLMTLFAERLPHPNWRLLLVVGFLGD